MKLGNRIRRIHAVDSERYRVRIEYADGFRGTVDLSATFENPARRPLVREILRGQLFDRCFIEAGALTWPNGYQLCPDALRAQIVGQRGERAA